LLRQMAQDIPNRQVVVIVGNYKRKALRAVLKGRLCNVLITDRIAAQSLLNEDQVTP
jgi:DNA-binding transcriptional regulator LsrR (DeoR family)